MTSVQTLFLVSSEYLCQTGGIGSVCNCDRERPHDRLQVTVSCSKAPTQRARFLTRVKFFEESIGEFSLMDNQLSLNLGEHGATMKVGIFW